LALVIVLCLAITVILFAF